MKDGFTVSPRTRRRMKHESSAEDAFSREREAYARLERINNDLQIRVNQANAKETQLRNALLDFVHIENAFGHTGQHPDLECADCKRVRKAHVALGHGYLKTAPQLTTLPKQEPFRHGLTCHKIPHHPQQSGFEHAMADDGPYFVDGVKYCGRCHEYLP